MAYLTSNKKIGYTFISRTSGRTERKHACEAVQSIISSYKLVCYSVKFDNLVPGPLGHCLNAWQYLGQVRQVSSPPDELLVLIRSLTTPGSNWLKKMQSAAAKIADSLRICEYRIEKNCCWCGIAIRLEVLFFFCCFPILSLTYIFHPPVCSLDDIFSD